MVLKIFTCNGVNRIQNDLVHEHVFVKDQCQWLAYKLNNWFSRIKLPLADRLLINAFLPLTQSIIPIPTQFKATRLPSNMKLNLLLLNQREFFEILERTVATQLFN